jgi:hypothetical protein
VPQTGRLPSGLNADKITELPPGGLVNLTAARPWAF